MGSHDCERGTPEACATSTLRYHGCIPMNPRTVYDVLAQAAKNYGHATALHQPLGKGKYKTYTWVEYRDAAQEIALGLRAIGIRKCDIVALFSAPRAEFD